LAATWVGEAFDCVSYTLEMPFKDNADRPDPTVGWSPERSQRLGQDVLAAVRAIVADLR
jgi:murein tripeptide amidase MpaA